MSRTYHMKISVLLPSRNDELIAAIDSAVTKHWPIDGSDEILLKEGTVEYVLGGVGLLTGGEGEDEFAARVARAIWDACGGYVPVEVVALYLDDPPYGTFYFTEKDYRKIKEISTPQNS